MPQIEMQRLNKDIVDLIVIFTPSSHEGNTYITDTRVLILVYGISWVFCGTK